MFIRRRDVVHSYKYYTFVVNNLAAASESDFRLFDCLYVSRVESWSGDFVRF